MAIFHLPQFEHGPFWQYLTRLNDYHAQYVHFTYEKWEICNIVLEGITYEIRAILEPMCYGAMCSLDVDDMWGLFKHLAWYWWHCERPSEHYVSPCHLPMICKLNLHVSINLQTLVITILFTLIMCALIPNLLTMMWIVIPIMIFLMSVMPRLIPW